MKRQIRRGVFETNSSSVHSITMCLKKDYDRWKKEELFLFTGSDWCYPVYKKPQRGCFYTKEEAIEFEKLSKYAPSDYFEWDNEEAVLEMLHGNEWLDFEYWTYYGCNYYETFEDEFTTPGGETIVAFGYYGHD